MSEQPKSPRPIVCVVKGSMSQPDIKRLRDEGYLVVVVKDALSKPFVLDNIFTRAAVKMSRVLMEKVPNDGDTYSARSLQAWMGRLMKDES